MFVNLSEYKYTGNTLRVQNTQKIALRIIHQYGYQSEHQLKKRTTGTTTKLVE
jgi:hypothetical protein